MKKNAINRDTAKQTIYKDQLKEESTRIYGRAQCYASHKPYKGLIASHIKPYKICVLENDTEAEFDINNGLLLAKAIDDYFDKLLITFDEIGKIIVSEDVPQEIADEFTDYYLDDKVYNEKRKEYMRIHRSLFFYKNYCQAQPENGENRLRRISIPYIDCGLKLYRDEIIVNNNGVWTICPLSKLKSEFIARTKSVFDMKYFISNADLLSKLSQEPEYIIDHIPDGFNTPCSNINLFMHGKLEKENNFKLCMCNYEMGNEEPATFISLLRHCFKNDEQLVRLFRNVVGLALLGKGFSKGIVLSGQTDGINSVLDIIMQVLGSYIAEYENTKILAKNTKADISIPNTRMLIIRIRNELLSEETVRNIVANRFFTKSVLNVDYYVPFFVYEGQKPLLFDAINIPFGKVAPDFSANEIVEREGRKILKWLLGASFELSTSSVTDLQKMFSKELKLSTNSILTRWLEENCNSTSDLQIMTSATLLFKDYARFAKAKGDTPLTERKFYLEMGKNYTKKRLSPGMFYCGISLKKEHS